MKPQKIILGIILTIILLTLEASSISINIEIKPQFTTGETVTFNYSITDVDENISYLVSVRCPDAPIPLLNRETADENVSENYTYLTVDEVLEPQTCNASVSVIEPYSLTEKESFEIVTDPSFSFELYLCKDQLCEEKSKIFAQGEDIYIRYSSGVSNPEVIASLNCPNETKQISIPYSMEAEQIGSYTVEANASREGYKNASDSVSFAVIERHANITDASECNANGTCDPIENHQTCQQDCPSGGEDGYCDLVEDGICDPDCNGTRDEDCRINYQLQLEEGWNLFSFPLERLERQKPPSPQGIGQQRIVKSSKPGIGQQQAKSSDQRIRQQAKPSRPEKPENSNQILGFSIAFLDSGYHFEYVVILLIILFGILAWRIYI